MNKTNVAAEPLPFGNLQIRLVPKHDADFHASCNFCPSREQQLYSIRGNSIAVRMCWFCMRKTVDMAQGLDVGTEIDNLRSDIKELSRQRDLFQEELSMVEVAMGWDWVESTEEAKAIMREFAVQSLIVRRVLYMMETLERRKDESIAFQQKIAELEQNVKFLHQEKDHYRDLYFDRIQNAVVEPTAGYVNQDDPPPTPKEKKTKKKGKKKSD